MKVGDLVKDVCGDLGVITKNTREVYYRVLWFKGYSSIIHHYHLELIYESR